MYAACSDRVVAERLLDTKEVKGCEPASAGSEQEGSGHLRYSLTGYTCRVPERGASEKLCKSLIGGAEDEVMS